MGRARKKNPTEPSIRAWQVQRSSGVFREPPDRGRAKWVIDEMRWVGIAWQSMGGLAVGKSLEGYMCVARIIARGS